MAVRLIGIAGPVEGTIFLLDEEFSIGRDSSNTLPLHDSAVSRRHCVVQRDGSQFKIRDLSSRNGTDINGVPVGERVLTDGDEIRVGRSVLLFAASDSEAELGASEVTMGHTVAYKLAGQSPERERTTRDLKTLLRIGSTLPTLRGLAALEKQLLELIFEAIPASNGAILLTGAEQASPTRIPQAVVDRIITENVAIISNDALVDEQPAALLAAPLMASEKVLGAIYLETRQAGVRFDEDHLELLTGIAGMAAPSLESALHIEMLERENQRLQAAMHVTHTMFGESPRMREVYAFIAKAAPSSSTVLIRGESGTGKELVARALHRNSPRAAKPLVAINCAVLTETLLESELFGHEKGAFTGAVSLKRGKLEEAAGGSVFLDEVGELAAVLQAKLLRVLQEREFERVGGTRPIQADIRLIAATNRDLEEAVKRGTFRQDLYYRLNVVAMTMPALRERRADIPVLATYFARKHGRTCGREVQGISEQTRECLAAYEWPGNVRELENAIERAVVLGSSEWIEPDDLPDAIAAEGSSGTGFHEAVREAKNRSSSARSNRQAATTPRQRACSAYFPAICTA